MTSTFKVKELPACAVDRTYHLLCHDGVKVFHYSEVDRRHEVITAQKNVEVCLSNGEARTFVESLGGQWPHDLEQLIVHGP